MNSGVMNMAGDECPCIIPGDCPLEGTGEGNDPWRTVGELKTCSVFLWAFATVAVAMICLKFLIRRSFRCSDAGVIGVKTRSPAVSLR